jgi:hypothetical protein
MQWNSILGAKEREVMGFGEFIIAIVAISTGASIVNTWIKHRTRIAELRLQSPAKVDGSVRAEIEMLRQEVRQLRETTTQFDLSFDTTLQRTENQVQNLERRVRQIESGNPTMENILGRK